MNSKKFHAAILLLFFSCNNLAPSDGNAQRAVHSATALPKTPAEVNEIAVPEGYKAISGDPASFAAWLGKVALKKDKTVYLYDGSEKQNQSAQYAVLDISVGNQNLQQCADAVMRLRAEYLYSIGKYDR